MAVYSGNVAAALMVPDPGAFPFARDSGYNEMSLWPLGGLPFEGIGRQTWFEMFLSTLFHKYANVSKHRLLTRAALIGVEGAESLEYATVFLKPRT
jgi:hypothetical protein